MGDVIMFRVGGIMLEINTIWSKGDLVFLNLKCGSFFPCIGLRKVNSWLRCKRRKNILFQIQCSNVTIFGGLKVYSLLIVVLQHNVIMNYIIKGTSQTVVVLWLFCLFEARSVSKMCLQIKRFVVKRRLIHCQELLSGFKMDYLTFWTD